MKQTQSPFRALALAVLLFVLSALTAHAQLTYTFNTTTGVLTIAGNGTTVESEKVNQAIGRNNSDAFNTSLKQIDFSGAIGITSIGSQAFRDCSGLTGTLALPAGITTIGSEAFYYCYGLTGSLTLPSGITSIGINAFSCCTGLTGTLTLPASLTQIGDFAFFFCTELRTLICESVAPPSITTTTFSSTNIKYCYVPEGSLEAYKQATGWSNYASQWSFLEKEVHASVNVSQPGSLGISILQQCGVHPATVTHLVVEGTLNDADFTYMRTNMPLLYDVDISQITNAILPDGAFQDKTLLSIQLPEGLTSIGSYAFSRCSGLAGSLVLPAGLTSIGYRAFNNCTGFKGSLVLPSGLTTIESDAFMYCKGFTGSLVLPESLITIGSYAFYECSSFMGTLEIPDGITTIGYNSFQNCSGLTSIKL